METSMTKVNGRKAQLWALTILSQTNISAAILNSFCSRKYQSCLKNCLFSPEKVTFSLVVIKGTVWNMHSLSFRNVPIFFCILKLINATILWNHLGRHANQIENLKCISQINASWVSVNREYAHTIDDRFKYISTNSSDFKVSFEKVDFGLNWTQNENYFGCFVFDCIVRITR